MQNRYRFANTGLYAEGRHVAAHAPERTEKVADFDLLRDFTGYVTNGWKVQELQLCLWREAW